MGTMDNQKRRNFLIVFGVLAAIAAGAAVYWSGNYPPQQASGAIGAVRKHREAQVAASDVVLGGEEAKRHNKILFADYLKDATALRSITAQLGSISQGSRDQIQNMVAELQSQQQDVQSRYLESMKETLNGITQLLNHTELANEDQLRASLHTLESRIASREQLNAVEMANLNTELGQVVSQLESAGGELLGGGTYGYNCGGCYGNMVQNLGSMQASLGSKDLVAATAALESAAKDLGSREQIGMAFSLENHQEYLGAIALESQTLSNAIEHLGSLSQTASREQLENIATELGSTVAKLESSALGNMQADLASQNQLASHLASFDKMVGSMQQLGHMPGLDSHVLESFNQALGSFSQALQSRETQFEAFAQGSMQAELGAISAYLGSHEMGNRDLGSRDTNLGSFQTYLGNLSQSLQNANTLGNMELNSRDQLASQARDLANKAQELGSKDAN
jgi:hypothetical protein